MSDETKEEMLSRLERELTALNAMLPEHCVGRDEYIGAHAASPEHWLKIEEHEEQIKKLKAELGR